MQSYRSLDGLLTFLTHVDDDGDITLGFEGFDWHTHGDLLVGRFGSDPADATAGFVKALLSDGLLIELLYVGEELFSVAIIDDDDNMNLHDEDLTVRRRYWSGATTPKSVE